MIVIMAIAFVFSLTSFLEEYYASQNYFSYIMIVSWYKERTIIVLFVVDLSKARDFNFDKQERVLHVDITQIMITLHILVICDTFCMSHNQDNSFIDFAMSKSSIIDDFEHWIFCNIVKIMRIFLKWRKENNTITIELRLIRNYCYNIENNCSIKIYSVTIDIVVFYAIWLVWIRETRNSNKLRIEFILFFAHLLLQRENKSNFNSFEIESHSCDFVIFVCHYWRLS